MPFWSYILTAAAAYVLGSIPTGFLAAKLRGMDLRAIGSGNIGATNAMRALGKPAGIAVLLLDILKGFAAAQWLPLLILNWSNPPGNGMETLQIVAGIFAVLGHNYTCWLKFKGGKGVATTAGVYVALAPWALLIAQAVFLLALLLTRYVSVGSISAAVALPAAVWGMPPRHLLLGIVTTALGAMVIYKHKSNIQRLRAGNENRLGRKREEEK